MTTEGSGGIRTLVLASRPEWLPQAIPDGVLAEVASDTVAQVRAAADVGMNSLVLFAEGETSSGAPMLVSDHINLTGSNPLVGPNIPAWGVRFPDMTEPYPLRTSLRKLGPDGVAADLPFPPSVGDLPAAENMGAQSVTSGLSAAVIAANHCGLRVGAVVIPTGVAGRSVVERVLSLMATD